jgi:hypothetical protein
MEDRQQALNHAPMVRTVSEIGRLVNPHLQDGHVNTAYPALPADWTEMPGCRGATP